jgi:hypothetical protein
MLVPEGRESEKGRTIPKIMLARLHKGTVSTYTISWIVVDLQIKRIFNHDMAPKHVNSGQSGAEVDHKHLGIVGSHQ